MQNHVHISTVSVLIIVAVVILTEFTIHVAAAKLASSPDESKQLWAGALANLA